MSKYVKKGFDETRRKRKILAINQNLKNISKTYDRIAFEIRDLKMLGYSMERINKETRIFEKIHQLKERAKAEGWLRRKK